VQNLLHLLTVTDKAAIFEHALDDFAVGGRAVLEEWMTAGWLAFAQVAGDGLAQHFFGRGQVEHVVDDLEGQADGAAVAARLRLFLLGRGAGQSGAQLHGDRKEAGGLAEDEVVVLSLVDRVAELLNLQQLAFDHLLGEPMSRSRTRSCALRERCGRPACRASRRPGRTSRCPRWCWRRGGRGACRRRR
jgi:hypothetical protein